jgi:hypothetical protein
MIGEILTATRAYSRSIQSGGSEAYCGARFIVALLRPFTAGEDAVTAWVTAQDDSILLGWVPMDDGRDFVLLGRLHTKQSYRDAVAEQTAYDARPLSKIPTQHGTPATRG